MVLSMLVLFVLALLLGIYLISFLVQYKETPKGVAFIHGSFAFLGIVLLSVIALHGYNLLWISIVILLGAAGGGFYLMLCDLTTNRIPKWLVLLHPAIAMIGVISALLILYK